MNRSRKLKAPVLFTAIVWLISLALSAGGLSFAAENAPELPKGFIERLEAAKTPAEQDEMIRDAGRSVPAAFLRAQLRDRARQLTLEGDYLRAAADNDLFLRLSQEAGVEEDVAAARLQIAFVLRECGDLAGALSAIDQSVAYYQAHPEHARGFISAYQVRGIIHLMKSDFVEALDSLHRALDRSEKTKWDEGIIAALNSIGEVYRTQGQPERALQYYERARQAVGDDNAWNMAFIFNNIGMSYDALGDLERAVENIRRARAVAEKAKMPPRVENSLAVLGHLELKRGALEAARENYGASLKLARELHDVGGEAQALLGQAEVARAAGDQETAFAQAGEAAELSHKTGQLDRLVPALTLRGQCAESLGREMEAARSFEAAIAAVEEMRGRVAGGDVERETFFAQQIEPYHALVGLFVRQNQPEKALAMAERASARVLLDITGADRAEMAAVLSAEERKAQRELDLQLAVTQRTLTQLRSAQERDDPAIAKHEAALREVRNNLENFEAQVRSTHPELNRIAVPAALASLADAAPLLRDGKSAVLRFVTTEEETFLFLLTKPDARPAPQLKVVSLGKDRATLARLTNEFRTRLATRSLAWEKSARQLYDLLLGPVAPELRGIQSLVIVPDGPLWELPFQALEPEADHPLLVDCTVRYAPSLSLLQRLEKLPVAPSKHALLALVNPALAPSKQNPRATKWALLDNDWQPLPLTEKQAPELAKIYPPPGGRVLVGAEAREEIFKQEAPQAGILHLATHGILDDRAPLHSYLLLSQTDIAPEEDGRLEARELMQLKLRARLAILCGCETARGQVTAGEGVVGLSWGFFVAGCPATIVSQWKVDSASSTPLMIELHRQLHDGAGNAEALRQASLALRKDSRYRHPFYWAPFVLVGADR